MQHIALASSDILTSVEEMSKVGFEALPISENYYSDLAARFELSSQKIDLLRAGNILYDEDASGAFYQCYSRNFIGGMFVEIVQRIGGYAGYGASNAPFRIAAQKRLARPKGMPRL